MPHLIVGISYKRGDVICELYETTNCLYFTNFVKNKFPEMSRRSNNAITKMFLQKGDPSQNCKTTRKLM